MDLDLLAVAAFRLALVAAIFATFTLGGTIRHGLRAMGRPVWVVRAVTIVTWSVALVLAGRLVLTSSSDPLIRMLYRVLFYAQLPILLIYAYGADRIQSAVLARPTRRVEMARALARIGEQLKHVRTARDREQIMLALADLDRFVEPATFEYIQLARSRVMMWLDGSLTAAREARWVARIDELSPQLRPASWQQGRVAVAAAVVGRWVKDLAAPLGAAAGLFIGRSILLGPLWLAGPAAILAGYLAAWAWNASVVPALAGAAVGLAFALAIDRDALAASTLTSGVVVIGILAASSLLVWRGMRPRQPRLEVLPPPATDRESADSDDDRPRAG